MPSADRVQGGPTAHAADPFRIMVIDDSKKDAELVRWALTRAQGQAYVVDWVDSYALGLAAIAKREGLHGAFALPILIGGQVVGVMEFFSREIREPDEGLLRMLTKVGAHIGEFMERKQAEETIARERNLLRTLNDVLRRTRPIYAAAWRNCRSSGWL